MRTLIVDDERLARNELKRLLHAHEELKLVGEAANAEEARSLIDRHRPELLFLDIHMPGQSGFELLQELDNPPLVIFTTAHDDYAIRAFEVNALDYLLKPVEAERLAHAVEKVLQRTAPNGHGEAEETGELTESDQVFVKDGDRCWFVKLAEVRLFESEGNYTRLFFGREKPLVHRSLNYLEGRLDARRFFRASRKHLLNLRWVQSLKPSLNGGIVVRLDGMGEVSMSRRQAQKFRELLSL